jgi:hypothetical protein
LITIATSRLFALLGFAVLVPSLRAEHLTYADLCARYTDMEHLAVLPTEGEIGGMASSYDRSSQYDAAKDQYINWGANGDGSGIVRREGNEEVLADIKGCGCIWRIWSANEMLGHVKIYLDGSSTPVMDRPFGDYMTPTFWGGGDNFKWSNLVYAHAGEVSEGAGQFYTPGGDVYIPIPFKTSCKIVGDAGTGKSDDQTKWGQYYHFTYTLFPDGVTVPDFVWPLSDEEHKDLAQLNDAVSREKLAEDPLARPGQKDEKNTVTVQPGQTVTALNADGSGAITNLKIKLPLPEYAEPQRELLRQLTIRITWDGADKPAVWSPLGDFFGYIGGAGPFKTVPVGLLDDGTFYAHWYMPFAKGAKIEIGNDGPNPVTLDLQATLAPLDKSISGLGRFHAKWHRDQFLIARPDRVPDWPMVLTKGRGKFVGTMLHVWNPHGNWWGEGDEKFFVDGEKFPSYFGTGSEDYFGYAWSQPGRWFRAFHAQILNENNNGHVDDQRWMIAEAVPFHTSFEGDIEKYFPNTPNNPKNFDPMSLYAVTSYWYLSPDGTDDYPEIPIDQRIGYWKVTDASYNEPGVIEAESMQSVEPEKNATSLVLTFGEPGAAPDAKAGMFSGDRLLGMSADHSGVTLKLKLPVEKSGKYQIILRPAYGKYYGIFQFGVDGKPIGPIVDTFAPGVVLKTGESINLGTLDLTAGTHILDATAQGKNPGVGYPNDPSVALALDYVKLVPVP